MTESNIYHCTDLGRETVTVEWDRTADWDRQWVLARNIDHRREVISRHDTFTDARRCAYRLVIACRARLFDAVASA